MEFALALQELLRRRVLVAVGLAVALIAALLSVYRIDGAGLKARSLQYSAATTQLLVDSKSSGLGDLNQSLEPLTARAQVYANFMASPAVLELIGKNAGIPGDQIYAAGPVNAQEPRVEQEPTALKRNVQITGESKPYRLTYTSQANLPTIGVYAQAPTTHQALMLANGAVVGLQQYLVNLQHATHTSGGATVTVRQLGPATGGVVDAGVSKALAAIVFIAVFFLWCVLVLVATRFRATWRASAGLGASDASGASVDRDSEGHHIVRGTNHAAPGTNHATPGTEHATPGTGVPRAHVAGPGAHARVPQSSVR